MGNAEGLHPVPHGNDPRCASLSSSGLTPVSTRLGLRLSRCKHRPTSRCCGLCLAGASNAHTAEP